MGSGLSGRIRNMNQTGLFSVLSDAGKPVEQQLSVFESESYRSLGVTIPTLQNEGKLHLLPN